MHRLFCGLRMIGPDMPGNDDPGSGREPRHKTDHQVGIGSGGGDRGQGVSVEIVAHDQGVHGIVEKTALLRNTAAVWARVSGKNVRVQSYDLRGLMSIDKVQALVQGGDTTEKPGFSGSEELGFCVLVKNARSYCS